MSYSLNTTILNPISKKKPKNAVILCHGYGGDGKDISLLANYWQTYLPDTIFICPDAPEKCDVSPTGFQWFDLMDQTEDQILTKSLVAEIKLNNLIDEVKKNNELLDSQIAIGGFSQGCMISLQTGIKRKSKIKCILGFSGKIINITSIVGHTGNVGQANYTASKAGIVAMSKSLAIEYAKKNINVNCISPGFISTAMTDKIDEKHKEAIIAKIPSNRLGKPHDIANTVIFLGSDHSDYINGETIHVNGGMYLG